MSRNITSHYIPASLPVKQKGVVLIVSLVMLLAMTILSMSSMTNSTIEERMSNNMRDREIALQATEAALRYGERLAPTVPLANFNSNCDNGYCINDLQGTVAIERYWEDGTIWSDANKHIEYNISFLEVSSKPKIIIEYMGNQVQDFANGPQPTDPAIYRITALGTGKSDYSRVMLQSTFIKP